MAASSLSTSASFCAWTTLFPAGRVRCRDPCCEQTPRPASRGLLGRGGLRAGLASARSQVASKTAITWLGLHSALLHQPGPHAVTTHTSGPPGVLRAAAKQCPPHPPAPSSVTSKPSPGPSPPLRCKALNCFSDATGWLSGHPQKSISRVSGAQVCRVGGPAWTRFEHRGAWSGERDRDRRPGLNRRDRVFRCVTRQTPLPAPKKPDAKLQGDRRAAAWPGSTGHLLRTARLPECTPGPGGRGGGGRPSDGAPVLWLGLNRDARTGSSRGPRFPRQTSPVTTRVPPGGPRTRWATGSTDALSLCPCDGGAPPPTLWGAKAISWGQRGTGSKAGNPVQGHIQVPLTTQLAKSPDLSWPVS